MVSYIITVAKKKKLLVSNCKPICTSPKVYVKRSIPLDVPCRPSCGITMGKVAVYAYSIRTPSYRSFSS